MCQHCGRRYKEEVQTLILSPAFALVSMKLTLNSRALASPSSIETCLHVDVGQGELPVSMHATVLSAAGLAHLLSTRSVLFPTRKMMTSLPRSVRTSEIHRAVFRKDCRSEGVEERANQPN